MFTYRAAKQQDIETLQLLEQAVVEAERPYNADIKASGARYYDLQALISSEQTYLLIVEDDYHIIATGYVQIRQSKPSLMHERHGYLGFMYVAPEYRGQGINSEVLARLLAWGKQQGVSDYYLDVYAANQSAINAYTKAGFAPSLMEMKLRNE